MTDIVFSMAWPDSRLWQGEGQEFNRLHRGKIQVTYQHFWTPIGYYDKLRWNLESAWRRPAEIGGHVIWLAEFAKKGWIADLSSRFPRRSGSSSCPRQYRPTPTRVRSGVCRGSPM